MEKQGVNDSDSESDHLSDDGEWLKSANKSHTLYTYDQNLSDNEGHSFKKVFSREMIMDGMYHRYFAVEYPIWQRDKVCGKKRSEIRYELLRTLKKLNEERHDVHDFPSPVEDIIDPDLLVYQPDEVTQNSNGYYESSKPRSG
jgi:hypothetical protein